MAITIIALGKKNPAIDWKRKWKWITFRNKKGKGKEMRVRTYWEFVRRRKRRREVDVEGHGTAQSRTEMLVPLVVPSEHLWTTDLCWFRLHPLCHSTALSMPFPEFLFIILYPLYVHNSYLLLYFPPAHII